MSFADEENFGQAVQNETSYEAKIMEPYFHLVEATGKRIFPNLCRALNVWFNIPEDKVQKIEEIIEVLYNCGLLIDDIQDNSILRKGIPTAHQIYGVPFTLNSACYMWNSCWKKLHELGNQQAILVVAERTSDFLEGQGTDIYYRENLICPTVEQYNKLSILKVGSAFTMVSQLIQMFSDTKYDLSKLGRLFALFLQVRGDYLNLFSEEYSERKSFCDDLSEGQFSFPIIHAIRSQPGNKIMNILKQKPKNFERKQFFLKLLKESGSLEYTKEVLGKVKNELIGEIRSIGDNPKLLDIIDILSYEE